MNQKNFEYLKDQVKFSGFGEGLENELKANIEKQQSQFELRHHATYGKDEVTAVLHFRKSDHSDLYFFNKYDLQLKQASANDPLRQTFYVSNDHTVTLKEGYNLMGGRAINKHLTNKEGFVYNTWMQLDFKQTDENGNFKIRQFHQNYGFDLSKELDKHLIKELSAEQDRNRLIESLNRGNRQMVTFVYPSGEQKRFIEASPQYKSINIYDVNLRRIGLKEVEDKKESLGETRNKEVKNTHQKQADADDVPKEGPKKSKRKRQSIH